METSLLTNAIITERIHLGKSNLQISRLGIGAWQWGASLYWDYGKGQYNGSDLKEVFEYSLQAGINFFDTAESYGGGRSESMLGKCVREAGQPVIVASKYMPYPWRWRKSSLVEALRRSLDRLGLEKVDLYQIHMPFPPQSTDFWTEAMVEAYESGLVQAVGVSNFSADQMRRSIDILGKRGIPLASNQVLFNLTSRKPEKNGLLQACQELGVTLIAYSPLAQGLLTGKYTISKKIPGIRRIRYIWYLRVIQPLIGLLREIGQAHGGKTPGQVAINWVMAKGAVPIPGAKNMRQAQENIDSLSFMLDESEISALDKASDNLS